MTTPARHPSHRDAAAAQRRSATRRLARHQRLLEVLLAHRMRPVSVDFLVAELGVSERTVERDLEALRASRLPLRSRGGKGGGVWLDVTRSRSPIALGDAELMVLLLALDGIEADFPPVLERTRELLRAQLDDPGLF